MHWLIGGLGLTIFTSVWVDTSAKEPTPPPYYRPEKGPPKDTFNCRINAQAVLPWIVTVWDTSGKMVVGHGSLLTYIVFITTCGQYNKPASTYHAHGQFVWDPKNPLMPCMQPREIETIFKHPKCTNNMPDFSFYDFSVFKLKKAFDITGTLHPIINLPTSQEVLMDEVKYINLLSDTKGCFLVSFRNQEEMMPVFNLDVSMQVIPFQEKCVKLLCENNPANPSQSALCEKQFIDKDNSTMLCVKNKTEANIQLGKGESYWLAGAPLICNGSTYGIASKPKIRHDYSTPEKTDFHYIVTFFRVFPWVVMQLQKYAAPWKKVVYIGNRGLKNEGDPEDEPDQPFTIKPIASPTEPPPASYAGVLPTPSIIEILLCLLSTIHFPRDIR